MCIFDIWHIVMTFWALTHACCCLLSNPANVSPLQISAWAPASLLWLTAAVLRSWLVSTPRCSVAATQDAAGLWDRSLRCALSGALVSTHQDKIHQTADPTFELLTTTHGSNNMYVSRSQTKRWIWARNEDKTSITFFLCWQKTGSLHNRLSMTWHEHRR